MCMINSNICRQIDVLIVLRTAYLFVIVIQAMNFILQGPEKSKVLLFRKFYLKISNRQSYVFAKLI